MSVNIRYPNITAGSEREQIAQIKSYLHQLVEQLNIELPNMGGSVGSSTYEVQGKEVSYYELHSLIIHELQEVDRLFEELSKKMQADYVSDEELPKIVEGALAQAKQSGEFDGSTGPQGPQGDPGEKGEDGFSPVVSVSRIEGGHRVEITDVTETHSFDVMDGKGEGSASGLYFEADDGTIFY